MNATLAYATLGPDRVLDALDSAGLHGDGRLIALNSYENRVYQIWLEDAPPVVAKFYRPARWSDAAILEEHVYTQALADAEIPVIAPMRLNGATLHSHQDFRFAVYPKAGGRMPEFDQSETLEWMGRFLARIHAIGRLEAYRHRPSLDIAGFGEEPVAYLLANDWLPADLREVWRGVAEQALEGVRRCYQRAGKLASLRLHGDCHAGNVLWTEDGPHFVDFDDSRSGPAVQDLWMLLSGDRASMTRQFSDILAGYEDFMEFDRRELHLVEALRTLRLLHYSAWLARRWDDPAFPAAFPWFGTQHYWQDRILELREQIAAMDEEPLWL
jgi:Ser/Thr protein kinase RdoA (MazF antagonist)